jgi:hypothetical protein
MEKSCISCGMPLRKAEDYPLGDQSKDYCVHCARADGTLKSYHEALEGMSAFIAKTQGLEPEAARQTARGAMAKMPAWRNRKTP